MISDEEMRRILDAHEGWQVSDVDFELSKIDFYRKTRFEFPTPFIFSQHLTHHETDALLRCFKTSNGIRVRDNYDWKILQPAGLAAYNDNFLTNFGCLVREEILQRQTQ